MLGVGAMSETVWDKLVKKLQQMIGEVERRTQQKETENLAGAGDGR
jgi:TRAP-type C4-dicarboxylate transport system substrate-binding protein